LKKAVVTIDGPAGSGKSTTARLVAERLGYLYLDTGAMYRAMTVKALRAGIDPADEDGLARLAGETRIDVRTRPEGTRVLLDGEDVTDRLRGAEVTRASSPVSAVKAVRERMVELQRRIGASGGIVVEGRDMGSVVFPDAEVKIYLDASLRCRAERRRKETEAGGGQASLEEVEEEIRKRDVRDSSREHSPLVVPEGAVRVDTTQLTIEEQVERVVDEVRKRTGARL
jgi:cytidylate kinase